MSFEFAQLWIFEELEQTSKNPKPVNVSGLIDAMSEYAKEHWAYGATTGDIPVGNGAVAGMYPSPHVRLQRRTWLTVQ